MLIGQEGCGKTTLIQAMNNMRIVHNKTQAIEFHTNIIDTPGEYIENKSYYKALIVTAVDSDIIALVQSCTDAACLFPPGFASIFSKKVIGIITKLDCKKGSVERATEHLLLSGVRHIYGVSAFTGQGLDEIKKLLEYR